MWTSSRCSSKTQLVPCVVSAEASATLPLMLGLTHAGFGFSRMVALVEPSLSVLLFAQCKRTLRFSAWILRKTTSRFPSATALGCTSETGYGLPVAQHPAAKCTLCVEQLRARPTRPGSDATLRDHTSRDFSSLGRHRRWSPVNPGLPPPASSAPGLSQAFDGLLLQTARLSCFVQTPPIGFKEHER